MTKKGLPGFLRRSIRNLEEKDDAINEAFSMPAAVGSPAATSLIPTTTSSSKKGTSKSKQLKKKEESDGDDDDDVNTGLSHTVNRRLRMELSSPDRPERASSLKDSKEELNIAQNYSTVSSEKMTPSVVSGSVSSAPSNQAIQVSASSGSELSSKMSVDTANIIKSAPSKNMEPSSTVSPTTSVTSHISSGAASSPNKRSPVKQKSFKEKEFENVIQEAVINIGDLRKLAWNGIPPKDRPQTWKLLLGYLPTNASRRSQTLKRKRAEYKDAIAQFYDIPDHSRTAQEQETLRQVLVDVPRTAPDVPLFRNDNIRQALSRLLYIWAMRHPASSYVQGINDLATPLVAVFLSEYFDSQVDKVLNGSILDDLTQVILEQVEADVYWCLTSLLAGIQDHYTQDQPGVQRMVMRLEELVTRMDVGLTTHLKETGVIFIQFAFRWMNCLLLREFKLESIIRFWDTYLSEGDGGFETFHVYVCAAFLCQFSTEVRAMEFDELFGFMQNIPTSDWREGEIEILLSQAFVLSTLFHGSDAHLINQR